MLDPMASSSEVYEWPTDRRGVVGVHAESCGVRDGERCICGPRGYRSSIEDPVHGTRVVSPLLYHEQAAAAWAESHAHVRAPERNRRSSLVKGQIEDFLEAASDGRARDPAGRRYSDASIDDLATALRGHVAVELGNMPLDAVRPWQVQAFVNELSDSGLSPGRLHGIVAGLRALFVHAMAEDLVGSNPADRIIVPGKDPSDRVEDAEPRPFTTTDQLDAVSPPAGTGFIPEQALWQLLKVATVVFVLIAIVLAAESI
jgi:hypothetical protein